MTIKELRTFYGLTQKQLSDCFNIPKRSIEKEAADHFDGEVIKDFK